MPRATSTFTDNELMLLAIIKANLRGKLKWDGVVEASGGERTLNALQIKFGHMKRDFYQKVGASNAGASDASDDVAPATAISSTAAAGRSSGSSCGSCGAPIPPATVVFVAAAPAPADWQDDSGYDYDFAETIVGVKKRVERDSKAKELGG